jgi:hypothetical protein
MEIGPNLDNTQVINALKESKSLSPEQCIALSSSSAENVASSYCALVVFTGALDPIPIASAYFRGTFGKSRNSARAWAILEKFPYAANSGPGLLLQAELLTGENDWPRLLDLVHNKSPELKKTFDKSVIEPALLFLVQAGFENDIPRQQGSEGTNPSGLAGKTFLYGSQPSNANALGLATPPQARRFSKTDAIRLGEVVGDLVELPNSLRRETIAMLQKNKGKKSLYSDEQDNEKITTLIQNLEKLIQVSPDLDPKNSPRDLGAQPEVALSKANQVKQKAPLLMPFGESFSKCEGGEYSLCSFAAVELISAAPPPTFAEMPLEKRKEAAILLLQKAASSGEVEAMSILFDLYEESLDSSRRPLADGILERLLSDRLPQGELRRAVRLIDRDPISGLFDVITSRKEIRESCALLEKLSTDPQLSDRDKVTAISFKGSVKCAVTKPLF